MLPARAHRPSCRRPATQSALRALATVVALLVSASALGQFAHFLLVPHAICAEHGELLELGEPGHASAEEASGSVPRASNDVVSEHEHCQALARGQREQAKPTPPEVAVLTDSPVVSELSVVEASEILRTISALSLAPKTSPPASSNG